MGSLPYAEALAAVLGACRPVGVEEVALADARGRILAERPTVTEPVPPFANSAMDGFAVACADVPEAGGALPLTPPVPAGTAPPPLPPGHAAPIATGAPLPPGADAVVPQEEARAEAGAVRLSGRPALRAHVRDAGSDLPAGAAPLDVGRPLGPAGAALLAMTGTLRVTVARRPRVAVVASGAELVPADARPGPAQIRESNSLALAWALTAAGAHVEVLGIADDEPASLARLCRTALTADLAVTCAGVSVGERDLVRGVLRGLGAREVFWGVDLKPGRPMAFAVAGAVPVLSLPGNPASALVCGTLFAEPAVRALCGHARPEPLFETATARGEWPAPERRAHAVRCALESTGEGTAARPTGDQRSHRVGSMVGADALALLEPGRAVAPGEPIRIVRV
jgi:molybdopterin molybdotransferase